MFGYTHYVLASICLLVSHRPLSASLVRSHVLLLLSRLSPYLNFSMFTMCLFMDLFIDPALRFLGV